MFRLLLAAAFLATAYAAACEELEMNYLLPPPGGEATMEVSICPDDNTIVSTMSDSDNFVAVEVLEDYDSGFAATRVESQNSCFVQDLDYTSLEQHASILRQTSKVPMMVSNTVDLVATPLDDTAEYGDRLSQFCGDLPAFKVGVDVNGTIQEVNARTLTISSNAITTTSGTISCVLILFLPFCSVSATR